MNGVRDELEQTWKISFNLIIILINLLDSNTVETCFLICCAELNESSNTIHNVLS
jgi:hypothetical protein